MLRYIIKRILWLIPVLIGVTIVLFALQSVTPGDSADLALGDNASDEDKYEWREQYGLNDPIVIQYGAFIYKLVTKGDLGNSYRTGKPVTEEVIERWPTTFTLALGSTLLAAVIGIVLGIASALYRGKWFDSLLRLFSMLGISIPQFWLALLFIIAFALNLKILPVSGLYGPKYWVLPIATLGLLGSATILRITRSAMLDNIQQDFVDTAKAKGQTEAVVIRHHILKNAMIPIITCIGILFATSLGGSMVMEQIFCMPGLGDLMITAINNRDYSQLRAGVMVVAITVAIVNLLIDIIYAFFDPRVRDRFKTKG